MANSKENINAGKNPSTENPETNQSARSMMMALITNRNKPNVRIVTGSVNKTKIGFTIKFKMEMASATIIAVK